MFQRKRREVMSTTTVKPGSEAQTEVFYDYVIYTTTTLRPNEGSTQIPAEPVPDGTTYRTKQFNPFVQVKKRSLLNNERLIATSNGEEKSVVKRQASDTTESSDTEGSQDATESSDTGSEATEASDTGSEATEASDTGETGDTTGSEESSDQEVPETPSAEEDPTEEETPVESSPEEASPVETVPVAEGPVADTSEPVEEPMVMPVGDESVPPVEADTSVPGGMSSRAYTKRSISTPEEQKEENSTDDDATGTVPVSQEPNCDLNSNEEDIPNDIEGNLDVINQVNHSEGEDILANSFTRISQVFVVQEIFIGNKKEDILETFDKYRLKYLN